jgi:hypothetical protein
MNSSGKEQRRVCLIKRKEANRMRIRCCQFRCLPLSRKNGGNYSPGKYRFFSFDKIGSPYVPSSEQGYLYGRFHPDRKPYPFFIEQFGQA